MPPMNLGLGLGLSRRGGTSTPAAPVITGVPTISGTIRTGQVLTATPASVSGSPTPTRTWQWVRAGVDIVGATAQTYTITNLDEGRNITVRQIETNGSGSASATSTATAVPFLLDQLSGTALAAWSSRQLRSGITALQRIRRSSDNLEVDIGPGADGRIDAAALAAHVGANSGFVRRLIDQTVNARNSGNGTAGNQPRIINAGVNEELNSRTTPRFLGNSIFFNASAFAHDAGGASFFFVTDTNSTNRVLFRERNNAGNARYDIDISLNGELRLQRNNDANVSTVIAASATSAFNGTPRVFALRDSGSFVEGFVNGSRFGTGTAYTRTQTLTGFNDNTLGGDTLSNTGITGDMPEFIVMSGAVSNEDLNTIIASQGGEYGIAVVPFLTPVQQLILQRGTGDGGSSWSTNLSYPNDSGEPRFLDRAKQARGWRRPDLSAMPTANLNSEGALASLPGGDTTAAFFFNAATFGAGYLGTVTDWGGRFRLTFTGSATVNFANAGTNVTQINANTYEFDTDWIGNKWFIFTPTSYPIKVTLVKTTDLTAHAGGQIIQQAVLDAYPSNVGCFRFMDWCGINNNVGLTDWSQMPVASSQRWSQIPYEAQIELAAAKNADIWVCMPPAATDDYFTQAATYLRDNVPAGLKIRVELGNEIWNTGTFPDVFNYFKTQAQTVWGVADGGLNNTWIHYYGKRFAQMMTIFNSVFSGQTNRIIGVLAGHGENTATAIAALDATQWQLYEPGSYVAPRTLAKEYSIAPYINWVGNRASIGDAIKAQMDISQAAAITYMKGLIPASLAQAKTWIDNNVPICAARNLRLTIYEYNSHFNPYDLLASTQLWPGGNLAAGALEVFRQVNYSTEMRDALNELRDHFKANGGSLVAAFSDFVPFSQFGYWGFRTHYADTTNLLRIGLDDWTAANPRNWNQ